MAHGKLVGDNKMAQKIFKTGDNIIFAPSDFNSERMRECSDLSNRLVPQMSISEELWRISMLVRDCAGLGYYSCFVTNLSPQVREKLEELGFNIYHEVGYYIEWGENQYEE